jgi:Transglycosylase SLT domain
VAYRPSSNGRRGRGRSPATARRDRRVASHSTLWLTNSPQSKTDVNHADGLGSSVAGRLRTSASVVGVSILGTLAALVLTVGMVAPAAARLSDAVPAEYRVLIEQAAEDCPGLPAELLAAQLHQESGFNPAAISQAGALGIAQFMPGTWVDWGRDADGNSPLPSARPRWAPDGRCRPCGRGRRDRVPELPELPEIPMARLLCTRLQLLTPGRLVGNGRAAARIAPRQPARGMVRGMNGCWRLSRHRELLQMWSKYAAADGPDEPVIRRPEAGSAGSNPAGSTM